MVPPTRRRVLHGAAGLAAVLAGCSSLSRRDGSTRTATRSEDPTGSNAGSADEFDAVGLRSDGDRPPARLADPDDENRSGFEDRSRHVESTLIDDPSRADRLVIADVPGADRARSFVAATDFENEAIYLETWRIEECFRLELCHVAWGSTRISTDYARIVRPYDERCAVGAEVFESRLIRIPAALSAKQVNEHASSVGSGGCDHSDRGEAVGEGTSSQGARAAAPAGAPRGGEQ